MIRKEERIGGQRLILGDCLSVMPLLGEFDLVLTDPPYVLSDAGPGESHFGMSLNKFDSKSYKEIVKGVDYGILMACLADVCKPFNMFCFCSNKQVSELMSINEGAGRATTLLIWHKTNAAPFANGVWRGDIEYIVHARGKGATFQGGAQEKKKVTHHPIVQDAAHPTVKPQAIIQKFLRIGSDVGGRVLDPFLGSGTTLVACQKLGRHGTGIELDPVHFQTACDRVQRAADQPDLFVAQPEPKQQQEGFDL